MNRIDCEKVDDQCRTERTEDRRLHQVEEEMRIEDAVRRLRIVVVEVEVEVDTAMTERRTAPAAAVSRPRGVRHQGDGGVGRTRVEAGVGATRDRGHHREGGNQVRREEDHLEAEAEAEVEEDVVLVIQATTRGHEVGA